MKNFFVTRLAVLASSLLMVLGGCQGIQLSGQPASLDNAAFMQLWDTYRHCQSGTDIDSMQEDVQLLTRAALLQEQTVRDLPFPLPDFVKRVAAPPVPRLAADPKAMAAACTLSAGRMALQAERLDLATGLFRTVLQNHQQPEYSFYVAQARIGLDLVDRAVQFARQDGTFTPVVIQVSSGD